MVAVRLITIACKMEALLLSSLTKTLSFPALLPRPRPSSFIDLSAIAAFDESKNAQLSKIEKECVPLRQRGGRWRQTERAVGSVEPPPGRRLRI